MTKLLKILMGLFLITGYAVNGFSQELPPFDDDDFELVESYEFDTPKGEAEYACADDFSLFALFSVSEPESISLAEMQLGGGPAMPEITSDLVISEDGKDISFVTTRPGLLSIKERSYDVRVTVDEEVVLEVTSRTSGKTYKIPCVTADEYEANN
ncbi:MAG: hypothetical protein H6621_01275 [Halobacteriovoraceae bacterium]|nr:hypothetical protein [Halobacteriovoraceae bacterium]MCB9093674.1 hypothetical protein [Halobacteriovoraceae bacterium]